MQWLVAYFVPRMTYLTKSIVSSRFQFLWLVVVVSATAATIHRRIQIEHFEWLNFLRTVCHLKHTHQYFSATSIHRIDCFVHENRYGARRWLLLLRHRWRRLLLLCLIQMPWQRCCYSLRLCCCIIRSKIK